MRIAKPEFAAMQRRHRRSQAEAERLRKLRDDLESKAKEDGGKQQHGTDEHDTDGLK